MAPFRLMRQFAVFAVLALALVGCTGGEGDAQPTAAPSVATPAATPTGTPTPTPSPTPASTPSPTRTPTPSPTPTPPPVTTSVWPVTKWYARVTCNNGTSFVVGPADSAAEITRQAEFSLIACSASFSATLAQAAGQDSITRAELEAAMEAELAASGSPFTLAELFPEFYGDDEVPSAERQDTRFSTTEGAGGTHTAAVTCADGTAFTVAAASTLEAALADGVLGVEVCADADALAALSVPQSGVVTRASLEAALAVSTATPTPPPQSEDDSVVTPANGSFSIWSTTTYSWSASCGSKSGTGSGYSSWLGAAAAAGTWTAANCN